MRGPITAFLLAAAWPSAAEAVQDPWRDLGDSATGGGVSAGDYRTMGVSTAVDSRGYPSVAWEQRVAVGKTQVRFRTWTGIGWNELDGSASNLGVSNTTLDCVMGRQGLALDPAGRPRLAWTESHHNGWRICYRDGDN